MCGVYGMVSWEGPLARPDRGERMARQLRHRGPDGDGRIIESSYLLGTQHLRIVDPNGPLPQPCVDPSRQVWLVCNGEIYNAPSLRRRWSRYPFRTNNDVEVVLPVYLEHGAAGFSELDGMFALAILDLRVGQLVLARDRAGEKPLFHTHMGSEHWFASEIPALLAAGVPRRARTEAVRELIALGYVREPRTPFEAIDTVGAGSALVVSRAGNERVAYWRPERIIAAGHVALEESLDTALTNAVRSQLRADVPVGVSASGGLDSSLIASLAVAAGGSQTPLFTVGFDDPSFDERAPARKVAHHLRLPIVEVSADGDSLCEAHEHLSVNVGEPLTDPAALPTWLLAREARRHVKVLLSGEGADELFGGYPTYIGHQLAGLSASLPAGVTALLRWGVSRLPSSQSKVPFEFLAKRFLAEAHHTLPRRHHAWFGSGLAHDVGWDPDGTLATVWENHDDDPLRAAMLADYLTYLREGLLPKIDRTTMLWSLEARAPFLDRTVTELALSLPTRQRVHGLTTKVLLKRIAARHLPRSVCRRRKRGLSVPIGTLLTRELRGQVDQLLAPDAWPFPGVLECRRVTQLLSDHLSGRANHARPLWVLFTIAKWNAVWAGDHE